MLDTKKFISLTRASRHLRLTVAELCDFLIEAKTPVYADSDFVRNTDADEPEMHQLKPSSAQPVLADNITVEKVEFLYPPKYKKFRMGVRYDYQTISRADLYLRNTDLGQIESQLGSSVGYKNKMKTSRIKSAVGQGGHWGITHQALLKAANAELKANYNLYVKPNGKVTYAKLAEFLFKNKSQWTKSPREHSRSLQPKAIASHLSKFDVEERLWSPKVPE